MPHKQYSLRIPDHAGTGLSTKVHSPYSGEVVAEVEELDAAGMTRAIDAAVAAFRKNRAGLPAHERQAILSRLAELLHGRHEELSLLIAREGGKPLTDARIEVTRAINSVRIAGDEAVRIHGREVPMQGASAAMGRLSFTTREPIGVVAAVSAFNHPLNLISHQVAPAVAAGCPVLIKPAPDTPVTCMVFMELLREAGLPPELGMAVPCSNEVAELLVTSDRIAFFSFIGSARVGWYLRSQLAPGVRCALEHGGASPVIVDETADLERTLPSLIKGGYYHAGQVCVSVQRVFVHRSRREEFLERLTTGVRSLVVGDPTKDKTEVGPLIRQAEVERVHEWVREAAAGGAGVIAGGEPLDHQCYQPTVLDGPPAGTKVMTEEIFGPVVAVNAFDTLGEAIRRANDVRWAFQAAIFTQDVDRALQAARELESSAVMINDNSAFRVDWMPFGGRGSSGLGVGGIGATVRDLAVEKLIVVKYRETPRST
ncbi:MAG: aldehyde dehydrogenase family protein [Acidobacteriota bacterium]|nr:aldehyde dehydrogenase family protein [Acidobacteriota bacterium]MDH3784001.1 aldehyde dehydrogenase family protein [Acidobacteriota bacterium]